MRLDRPFDLKCVLWHPYDQQIRRPPYDRVRMTHPMTTSTTEETSYDRRYDQIITNISNIFVLQLFSYSVISCYTYIIDIIIVHKFTITIDLILIRMYPNCSCYQRPLLLLLLILSTDKNHIYSSITRLHTSSSFHISRRLHLHQHHNCLLNQSLGIIKSRLFPRNFHFCCPGRGLCAA